MSRTRTGLRQSARRRREVAPVSAPAGGPEQPWRPVNPYEETARKRHPIRRGRITLRPPCLCQKEAAANKVWSQRKAHRGMVVVRRRGCSLMVFGVGELEFGCCDHKRRRLVWASTLPGGLVAGLKTVELVLAWFVFVFATCRTLLLVKPRVAFQFSPGSVEQPACCPLLTHRPSICLTGRLC